MQEGQLMKEGQIELLQETLNQHREIIRTAVKRMRTWAIFGGSTREEALAWADSEALKIWAKYVGFCTKAHSETLLRKRRNMRTIGDYGEVDVAAWEREIRYFLTHAAGIPEDFDILQKAGDQLVALVDSKLAELAKAAPPQDAVSVGLSPKGYEEFCAEEMRLMGWDVRLTKASGDQGVDVVARRNGVTVVLQCKLYAAPVGNKAVQEIYAGKQFEGADVAVVVSNQEFTQSARQLAQALNVGLLHESQLRFLFE